MSTQIKICGITEPITLKAACDAGADFIGFVFYPPSPRAITPQNAAPLIESLPSHTKSVALFVNPTDEQLETTLRESPVDFIQLHGTEDPERVKAIKTRFKLPIIKAIGVNTSEDITIARTFEDSADWLLFDHKPTTTDAGGTGQSFDWSLLQNQTFKKPWMLSGGLTAENVKIPIRLVSPTAVDISSGVESTRGVKDTNKIKALITAVKTT